MISSFASGFVLILVGALVWKFKWVTLITGRNRTDWKTDIEGLANWIGKNMIFMGIVIWVVAVIQIIIFKDTQFLVDLAIILLLSTRMAMGMAKYSKPLGKPSKGLKTKKTPKRK